MLILQIILLYLLRVSLTNQELQTKKRLLDAWEEDGDTETNSEVQGEIVFDFFKSDQMKTKKSNKIDDDIIILPFFSDEVFTLSDIPEEKNWNFVEINSTKDLVAMENPKQRKYKTQMFKMRPKIQKALKQVPKKQIKNNWNLFKHKFPSFNSKITSNTKKEKRHIPPVDQKTSENVMGDPWARVDIKTENNPKITFGSYDEFGRKIQHQSVGEDRLLRDVQDEKVEDDMTWNITFHLDQYESQRNRLKLDTDSIKEKNDKMNEFSVKLERLYEKLETLKNIKAARQRFSPRPPVGNVPKLDRPIAVIVRQDSHQSSRPVLLETSVSLNEPPKPGQPLKPLKQRSSMLSKLKDKFGFLIPPKIQRLLKKKPEPPTVLGRALVNTPPWYHYGIPPEIQHRINNQMSPPSNPATHSQSQTRTSKSLLDMFLPNLPF